MRDNSRPPRLSEWLLCRVVPSADDRDGLLGDLHQEFLSRAVESESAARRWYRRQSLSAVRTFTWARLRHRRPPHGNTTRKGDNLMLRFWTELGLATRRLARAPGFTAIAGLTLALGLGANIAIFTVLNGVVLKPLPYHDPDRLFGLWHSATGLGIDQIGVSDALFVQYRTEVPSFESLGLYDLGSQNLTGFEIPIRLTTSRASSDLFPALGVSPALGRGFTVDDERLGAPSVVVLSHGFWRDRFGADANVLGRTISLDGNSYEIVGIMPAGFAFPNPEVRLWRPSVINSERMYVTQFSYNSIVRLAPGATPEGVAREIDVVMQRISDIYPNQMPRQVVEQINLAGFVTPYKTDVIGDISTRLWILLVMVGLVLLIACANVANLFIVRAEGRRREIAVRTALGATPRDLAAVFFAESATLSLVSGAVAVATAWAAVRLFVAAGPEGIPRLDAIGLDWWVLAYAAAISGLAAVFLGVFPLLKGRTSSLMPALKEGSRSATVGRDRNLVRHGLIIAQVTMAMVLMIGSGLLLRSFFNLRSVDPGLAADGVTTIGIALPGQHYGTPEVVEQFHRQLRDGIHDVAGVRAVGMISHLPLTQTESQNGFWVEEIANDDLPLIHTSPVVMPGYFDAMRIPLVTGRLLNDRDALNRTNAVVVSESFAHQYWNSTQVLGKRVKSAMGRRDGREPWSVIVGVVGDVRSAGLSQDPGASIYFPALSAPGYVPRAMTVVVLSDLSEAVVSDRVRAVLSGMDGSIPVADIRAMEEIVKTSMAREAFTALLLAVAAGIALLLGAVGIYGVISYIFAQRAAEIGVRMALGARSGDVVGLVMRQSVAVTAVGIGVGLVASLLVARTLEVFLFGVTAYDPVIIVSVPLLLFGVAGLASLLPALRAGRTDPAIVMRAE